MSDDHIEALRSGGYVEAADHLQKLAHDKERADLARKGPGQVRPAAIRVMDDAAFGVDEQARREGAALLEEMQRAGIGQSVSGGSVLGDDR